MSFFCKMIIDHVYRVLLDSIVLDLPSCSLLRITHPSDLISISSNCKMHGSQKKRGSEKSKRVQKATRIARKKRRVMSTFNMAQNIGQKVSYQMINRLYWWRPLLLLQFIGVYMLIGAYRVVGRYTLIGCILADNSSVLFNLLGILASQNKCLPLNQREALTIKEKNDEFFIEVMNITLP